MAGHLKTIPLTINGPIPNLAMNERSQSNITEKLQAWQGGDSAGLDEVMPLVYDELHRRVHACMRRERPGHILQTSALVNEAYLKLAGQKHARWHNRIQFFGIAAQMMRRILVDHARSQKYAKRGGGALQVSLSKADHSTARALEVIRLDEALAILESIDPRQGQVVELRFFAGLTIAETAQALGISVDTVKSEWITAKAWLYHQLSTT